MNQKNSRVHMGPEIIEPESIPVKRSSYAEISERSRQLREVLAERRIHFHRDSTLGKLLRDAETLARDWDEGKREHDFRKLVNSAYANRIAEAILEVRSDPAAKECLTRIASNDINLSGRIQSQGKDHLWELDLLYLLRRHGLACKLVDPPDIVLDLAGFEFPIACKKIYSEKGVQAQMRKGAKQLVGHGAGGLIAFNIDDLVPDDTILKSKSRLAASDFLANFNQDFIERHRLTLQRFVMEARCDGVLVSTSVLADLEASAPRFIMVTQTAAVV